MVAGSGWSESVLDVWLFGFPAIGSGGSVPEQPLKRVNA
jgi:hypothetical protein